MIQKGELIHQFNKDKIKKYQRKQIIHQKNDNNNHEILLMKTLIIQQILVVALMIISQDQLFEAEKLCNSVLEDFSKSCEAHNYKGYCLEKQTKFNEAINIMINQSNQTKNDAANYFFKGIFTFIQQICLLAMEKYEEAVALYNNAIILNPNMIELYNSQATALAYLQKDNEIFECCEQGLKIEIKK